MSTGITGDEVNRNGSLTAGDRVVVLDAPSWCREHFSGKVGCVSRVLPFPAGDIWVQFDTPVAPWCSRMDPVEEFPFSWNEVTAA